MMAISSSTEVISKGRRKSVKRLRARSLVVE